MKAKAGRYEQQEGKGQASLAPGGSSLGFSGKTGQHPSSSQTLAALDYLGKVRCKGCATCEPICRSCTLPLLETRVHKQTREQPLGERERDEGVWVWQIALPREGGGRVVRAIPGSMQRLSSGRRRLSRTARRPQSPSGSCPWTPCPPNNIRHM